MASTEAANALQSHRPRPSTARPIVPAIPLPYIQKRKQHASVPTKKEEVLAQVTSVDTSKTTSPLVADSPVPSANGNADSSGHAEVEAEFPAVVSASQEVKDSPDVLVDEVQEATPDASPARK